MTPLSFYKCLSEQTRLNTLVMLVEFKQLCVCELVQALDVSQPKLSRHLADLRQCGIVTDERRGKWVYYAINTHLPEWAHETLRLAHLESRKSLASAMATLTEQTAMCQTESA